jgi:hypothetical protein
MNRRRIALSIALVSLTGVSAAAVSAAVSPEGQQRLDVRGATFGQLALDAPGTKPDYVQIAWPGPNGETLYVSREAIESGETSVKSVPAIDDQGLVWGQMQPGRGLVINGKSTVADSPTQTSYLAVP